MYPGTPYDKVNEFNEKYQEDGIIWFLESCDLNIMAIPVLLTFILSVSVKRSDKAIFGALKQFGVSVTSLR